MADSIIKLTRELIREFAKDHRTVRFFEQLQGVVVDALPVDLAALFLRVDQATTLADDALAIAQQANARLEKEDPLLDLVLPQSKAEIPLLDVPVNSNRCERTLNDVAIPQSFERPLLDVVAQQKPDCVLPEILIPSEDSRKLDAITSSYGTRWVGSSSGLTVDTTEVDLTAAIGGGTQTDIGVTLPFSYVGGGTNAFFASLEFVDSYFFDIVLRLSGTCPSPASQSQPITFYLRRVDGSLITTSDYVVGRGLSSTFTNQTVAIPTFVFSGGADPYQTQGFRISAAAANAGWSITDKILFLKR